MCEVGLLVVGSVNFTILLRMGLQFVDTIQFFGIYEYVIGAIKRLECAKIFMNGKIFSFLIRYDGRL